MGNVLDGSYDYRLVLLSIVVAVVGGHAGLELAVARWQGLECASTG